MKTHRPSSPKAGTLQLLAASLALPLSTQAALFSDDFNADSSGSYNTVSSSADTSVQFAFDYATLGIPSAPNTTDGSTLGLRMAANIVGPNSAEGVTLHTTDQFTGSYLVTFDAWLNAHGSFPAGGSGSTEFLTAGVGGDGTSVNRGGATGSGGWTAVSGEGGSSRDYRAYRGGGEQFAESGQFFAGLSSAGGGAHNGSDPYYSQFGGVDVGSLPQVGLFSQQTGITGVGAFGFEWHEVELLVDDSGAFPTVTWSIDGLPISRLDGSIGGTLTTDGTVTLGFMDIFTSVSGEPEVSFGLIDNFAVSEIPEPSGAVLLLAGLGGMLFRRRR